MSGIALYGMGRMDGAMPCGTEWCLGTESGRIQTIVHLTNRHVSTQVQFDPLFSDFNGSI